MTDPNQLTHYDNAVMSAGENPPLLTVRHLKDLLDKCQVPDDALLTATSDEEGNDICRVFIIAVEQLSDIDLKLAGLPNNQLAVLFYPAI